jgi:hypothetical protein
LKKGCLIALGIPVGLVILVIGLFWLNYYHVHVRYRLTIEVQDGGQIKTGSSVIDVSYAIDPGWIWEGPNSRPGRITGYAPTVDLGEKGMLFLTFSNATPTPDQIRAQNKQFFCVLDDMWCLPFAGYGKLGTGVNTSRENLKVALDELLRQSGSREVPFAVLPTLLRVRDINDLPMHASRFGNPPRNLVGVSPYDLAASFGPGVELKRVVVQLTDDPVTPPPEIWPQWLKEMPKEKRELLAVDIGYYN